jgi:hypothetical protein
LSSAISESGEVMMRAVKPAPGPAVPVKMVSAPKISSLAEVVVAEPLLAVVLLPTAAAVTSSGLEVSAPAYSKARMSG